MLIGIGLITLTSCQKKITEKVNIITKDSIVYNISWKDTTIVFPEESVELDGVRVKIDTSGKAQLKPVTKQQGRAKVTSSIKDNILTSVATCDELVAELKLKETEILHLKETVKETQKEVPIKKTSSFQQFTVWWFFVSLFLIIIVLIIKFK